jgi:hypothetical protein
VFGPIPKTSTGKIQKFMLRKEAESAEATSDQRPIAHYLIKRLGQPGPTETAFGLSIVALDEQRLDLMGS